MSSRDGKLLRRLALVGALSLALAGCFRPVYGDMSTPGVTSKGGNASVAELMRSVDVKPIEGRVGGKLRNELIFLLTGGGGGAPVAYRVTMSLSQSGRSAVVDPIPDIPETRTIMLTANYQVSPAGRLDPVLTDTAFASATYFSGLQRFANIRAERDAEDRAATQIAERIRARLQSYFAAGR